MDIAEIFKLGLSSTVVYTTSHLPLCSWRKWHVLCDTNSSTSCRIVNSDNQIPLCIGEDLDYIYCTLILRYSILKKIVTIARHLNCSSCSIYCREYVHISHRNPF